MDEKYFQNLLEDTRAICKEYELLNKEKIINCMASYPSIKSEKNKAIKDIARMQKQKTPKEEIKAAEEKHKILEEEEAKARENILKTLEPLLNEIRLDESKDLKASLMKCAIINQATPKKLAQFCKKQEANSLLISELLDSVDIMMEMITFGGAKNGNWGRAYQIYKELLALVDDTEDSKYIDVQYRLAMAVAVELAEPIEIYGYVSMKEKPKVDPIKRWKHYVGACKRGELDPAFPYFSTWEYRWVVNCEAADDQLQWGRDYLKRYRPDHVVMGDRKWRYAEAVRSDVGYRKPNWTADPRTFQQMVSGGGRCGPRAWYGRFMCKAFGTPSWGVKQPAHAAASRWTPSEGWVTLLGGGWHKSNWDGREGLVFRTEAHARSFMHENTEGWYRKVSLLECMAEVYNEDLQRGESAKFDPKLLWRSLVNASRELLDASASEEHFRRGPNNGENDESYPCCITEYLAQSENKKQHKKFEKLEDGTIRIPAIGFDKKKNVDAHQSFEGGFQIHLKDKAEVEYKMPDIVSDQDYELVAKICNVHLAHEQDRLCVHVNDETVKGASIPLLYTIGDWRFTAPIQVHLNCGDVLKITREVFTGKAWGLTIREFLLMPC